MNLIIAGSRNLGGVDLIERAFAASGFPLPSLVISGGARGIDTAAIEWAEDRGIATLVMPADWRTHGNSAGYVRNVAMSDAAGPSGALLAIWDGQSRGTRHMIDIARRNSQSVAVWNDGAVRWYPGAVNCWRKGGEE